ncbi:MAG: CtsR family transcriptional regulator [Phascolarctobacterium sp.]|nr:CtsR family transcriptional regulator [Phascolarctobacterium sp.]
MKNLADAIENFIIGELIREHEEQIMVQRNELAERLSCAPSQISYVLNTRFTPERGYLVESRRGSGGFVRIVRLVPEEHIEREPNAEELLDHYVLRQMITVREAVAMKYMLSIMNVDEDGKKEILHRAMNEMNNITRR